MALIDVLKSRDFTVVAEMETPKGVDISDFIESGGHLKGMADAVLIPDMGHAVMRLSALAGAVLLKREGLETIIQFCCRDRNRLALQADLLASHVLGVANVMAVDGEAVELGDHLEAKPVYDLNAASFLEMAQTLGQGRDMAGKELKGTPRFCLGARIEPWVDETQMEVRLAEAKEAVAKGASFLVAPPVYDVDAFGGFMAKAKGLGTPILASVLLLKSVGMARYLNENLPGTNISDETILRIRKASDRPGECVKIAAETIKALRSVCDGALVITAGWESSLPRILQAARA